MTLARWIEVACALVGGGCGGDGTVAVFADDYAATYHEVRTCRLSLDHDLMYIRVLASPDAIDAYRDRAVPFPVGSIVLKEQYADNDSACAGPIERYTVMERLDPGSSPGTLDWQWQKVSSAHKVQEVDGERCIGCHELCGVAPDGYEGTCAVP